MKKRYLLADHTIDKNDIEDLIGWLKTDPWLTQGALVHKFERSWAKWLGTKYATFVNSGSSANLLMYYALLLSGRLRNKKVIVPAVSWSTTVAPSIQLGFNPIMCEADWTTFGLDTNYLEKLLKKHTPGTVVIVHVLGVPNYMDSLLELKKRYKFVLLEDSCAATGSRYKGKLVGTFGEMSTFSFFYGHHLSTIEGGMICTNDERLHDILVQIRAHGWAKDLEPDKEERQARERRVLEFNRPFTFYNPGFNVRSTELNARIGLSQMKKIEHVVKRRIENQGIYESRFGQAGLHFAKNEKGITCSISFAALAKSPGHRDKIARALRKNRIETRPLGGGNMSRQPFWEDRYGKTDFPIADRIHRTSFQLPNHPCLSPEDIHYICDTAISVKD